MKICLRTCTSLSATLLSGLLASACAVEAGSDRPYDELADSPIEDASVAVSGQALRTNATGQIAVFSNDPEPKIGEPYTPLAAYRLNVADITRTSKGWYVVRLSGLDGQIGPIPTIAVAYGSDNIRCASAGLSGDVTPKVTVHCHRPDGSDANSRFVLSGFSRPWTGRAAGGLVFGDGTSLIFNSVGTASASHSSTGNYTVSLTNLGTRAHGGTVQVGSDGTSGRHCKVVSWFTPPGTTRLDISVRCFKANSDTTADSSFEFMYDEEIPAIHNRGGYSWANDATSASYHPDTAFTFMRGPGIDQTSTSATASLLRNVNGTEKTGNYQMIYNGLSESLSSESYVYVGAYGASSDYCKIASWTRSPGGCTSNCDILVNTLCFDKAGNPKNTKYVQTWGSFNILAPN